MSTTTTATSSPPDLSTPNMDWLLSEPLLDAALSQISSPDHFSHLWDTFQLAESNGQEIPDSIRAKLEAKRRQLHTGQVQTQVETYLKAGGFFPLLDAKRKWDDVHFMAEAHGVGSSIPMVSYTGLSQEQMQEGMNAFYTHLKQSPLALSDEMLQKEVTQVIVADYKEVHETAVGEFGGYTPFQTMVDHTPEKVQQIMQAMQNQKADKGDTAMDYLTSQAQFP